MGTNAGETNAGDVPEVEVGDLDPEAIADFLRRHPDFLSERPTLLSALTPPTFQRGDGVVDMQRFMIDRLRAELATLQSRERTLLDAARANAMVQARCLRAALALNEAPTLARLIRTLNAEVPGILDVAAVALGIETTESLPAGARDVGIVILAPGTIDSLVGPSRTVALAADETGDRQIFGRAGGRVRSMAFIRLSFGVGHPTGLLALGSSDHDGFHPGQATDLLSFIARVLEQCVRRWLTPAD
ncbi:MAG: DUF484 family protein [Alphaproteobacteria bacterium]|nr:DUF484 family protein [Alphaproteobacteria bacterium]